MLSEPERCTPASHPIYKTAEERRHGLSWETLIERLAQEGLELSEQQLIALPFACELSARLRTQLADCA